jgi:hypothetical protein
MRASERSDGVERQDLREKPNEKAPSVDDLTSALAAIYAATRDDAKGEWWTLRRWCDQRGIFHDDIQGGERLTGIVAGAALERFTGRKPR